MGGDVGGFGGILWLFCDCNLSTVTLLIPYSINSNLKSQLPSQISPKHPFLTPQREAVLLELSKKREIFSDLAPVLWHSYGTIASLLQEICGIYSSLSPPSLTAQASNRVCNALALLQCVASHPQTRSLFLSAHIPLYLYPFLATNSKQRPFEYLRLTSLGVIGALVKVRVGGGSKFGKGAQTLTYRCRQFFSPPSRFAHPSLASLTDHSTTTQMLSISSSRLRSSPSPFASWRAAAS